MDVAFDINRKIENIIVGEYRALKSTCQSADDKWGSVRYHPEYPNNTYTVVTGVIVTDELLFAASLYCCIVCKVKRRPI